MSEAEVLYLILTKSDIEGLKKITRSGKGTAWQKILSNLAYEMVELILAKCFSVVDVKIEKNTQGKPYLVESNYFFSISHCKTAIAVAVAKNVEVGIDIERLDRQVSPALFSHFLNRQESEEISGNIENAKQSFIKKWVQKESYLKNIGIGIGIEWQNFNLSDELKQRKLELFIPNMRQATGHYVSICACKQAIFKEIFISDLF